MRVLTKYKLLIIVLLVSEPGLAVESGVFIENLSIYQQEQKYVLDADVKFQLSPEVEQALRNGVSLVWGVRVKVWKKRELLWDELEESFTDYYRIRYYALLGMFQILDEQRQVLQRFTSLRAALSGLGKLRNIRVANITDLPADAAYDIGLQIVLDKAQLPLPLRAVAHVSQDWALTSLWQKRPLN